MRVRALCSVPSQCTDSDRPLIVLYCTFASCICLQLPLLPPRASFAIDIKLATFGVSVKHIRHLLLLHGILGLFCLHLTYCSISLTDIISHRGDRSFSDEILRHLSSLYSLCGNARRDILLEQDLARHPRSRRVGTNATSEKGHDPVQELPASAQYNIEARLDVWSMMQTLNQMHSLAGAAQHVSCPKRRFSTGTSWEVLLTNISILYFMDPPSRLTTLLTV
jgi:hypothetical protein